MSTFEWMTLLISALAVVVLPLLAVTLRGVVKWTRIESKVDTLTNKIEETQGDLKEFAKDKEKAHTLIYEQMRDDREATNRRLRWLEEHLWKGQGNAV